MIRLIGSPRLWAVIAALGMAFAFASDRAAGSAALSATVRGPGSVPVNDFGFFTITITNSGDATAHGVAFSVGFPDEGPPSNETNDGAVNSCPANVTGDGNGHAVATLGDLAAGESVSCTLGFGTGSNSGVTIHHPWTVSSTGAGSASGEYDFAIVAFSDPPKPPFNDDRANAAALASGGGEIKERTDGGTLEAGEPTHAGDAGGSSVWFSWTPNFTGIAKVDTLGSQFDTLLEARDPSTNAVLAANDDGTGTSSSPSIVCFPVTKGAPVLLVADGYAGSSGRLQLNYISDPATAPCPGPQPVVTGVAGADATAPTVGETLSGTNGSWFDNGGGTTVAYQWYSIEYDCSKIEGATGSTYEVQGRDLGTALRLEVSETLGGATGLNLSDPTGVVGQPAVPHDNGRIFWASNRGTGLDYEIYSEFEDGSSFQQVSSHPGFDSEPSATMDGTAVAWVQGSNDLVVAAADGTGFADLETTGRFPSFAPDVGSRIAFAASDGIHVTDGLVDTFVIPLTGDVYDLAWSPDGKEILFSYAPGGTGTSHSLYVVRADGRDGISPVTSSPSDDFGARWSPDGSRIAFVRGQLNGSITSRSLYVMDADGSNIVKYVGGSSSGGASSLVNSVAWSPDGTKLVYSQDVAVGSDDLFVIPSMLPIGTPRRITDDPGRDELPFWATAASYFLQLATAGNGSGRVTSSPAGIDCTGSCGAQFADPQPVTLTAAPAPGSTFTGWSGACSGTGTCTVPMLGDRAVTATFAGPPPAGGGGGSGSSSFAVTVDASKTQAKPGDAIDFVASIRNTSGVGAQSVHAFIAIPPGATLQAPPYYESGNGCISEVNYRGGMEENCNIDYVPGGGTTHLRYEMKVTAAGDLDFAVSVTARNEEPGLTDGYSGHALVHVAADTPPVTTTPAPPPRMPSGIRGVTKTGNARANVILGTARNDRLNGAGGNDVLRGLAGSDALLGGSGDDRLFGGPGNDHLVGGAGKDTLHGDAGNDTISARDGTRDVITCGTGRDIVVADQRDVVSRDCEVVHRR